MKVILLLVLVVSSCSRFKDKNAVMPIPGSLEDAVNSSFRDPENINRDKYQHPLETLEFFGIRSDMAVVEISPGAGYYTEILAPFLAKEGELYLAVPRLPSRPPKFMIQNERKLQDILLRNAEIQRKTKLIPFEPHDKRNKMRESFADMVVTFNSVHNWIAKNTAADAFTFFYKVLKPGGTLGVVQHRIPEGKRNIPKSGYLTEDEVISLAENAGFKLEARSEINANPRDTADYPQGVWVLPPTYRLGKQDKRKYEKIGESDRMTLKFKRP